MPNVATLADIQDYGIDQQIGIPSCDPRFIKLVNKAQKWLSESGRWYGSIAAMRFCFSQGGCITLPRQVATVEKMTVCEVGLQVRNQWWEFQEYQWWSDASTTNPNYNSQNGLWQYNPTRELLDRGRVCTAYDVSGGAQYIQLYPSSASDAGKKIILQGKDVNNYPIFETLTLPATGYVQSTNLFAPPGITAVQKPITVGQVNVNSYDPVLGQASFLGFWEASEKYPNYIRKYFLNWQSVCNQNQNVGITCCDQGNGCQPALVGCTGITSTMLVRLEFIDALVPTDWLFIPNLKALEMGMMSDWHESRNNHADAIAFRKRAIDILRAELDKYQPPNQATVRVSGMANMGYDRTFRGVY